VPSGFVSEVRTTELSSAETLTCARDIAAPLASATVPEMLPWGSPCCAGRGKLSKVMMAKIRMIMNRDEVGESARAYVTSVLASDVREMGGMGSSVVSVKNGKCAARKNARNRAQHRRCLTREFRFLMQSQVDRRPFESVCWLVDCAAAVAGHASSGEWERVPVYAGWPMQLSVSILRTRRLPLHLARCRSREPRPYPNGQIALPSGRAPQSLRQGRSRSGRFDAAQL
jgi:hypothetical protein